MLFLFAMPRLVLAEGHLATSSAEGQTLEAVLPALELATNHWEQEQLLFRGRELAIHLLLHLADAHDPVGTKLLATEVAALVEHVVTCIWPPKIGN